jgi:hypothetical protein
MPDPSGIGNIWVAIQKAQHLIVVMKNFLDLRKKQGGELFFRSIPDSKQNRRRTDVAYPLVKFDFGKIVCPCIQFRKIGTRR